MTTVDAGVPIDDEPSRPPPRDLSRAFDLLASMPRDFFKGGRHQPGAQERPPLKVLLGKGTRGHIPRT